MLQFTQSKQRTRGADSWSASMYTLQPRPRARTCVRQVAPAQLLRNCCCSRPALRRHCTAGGLL